MGAHLLKIIKDEEDKTARMLLAPKFDIKFNFEEFLERVRHFFEFQTQLSTSFSWENLNFESSWDHVRFFVFKLQAFYRDPIFQ